MYLTRHDVACDVGEYLNSFSLDQNQESRMQYNYMCCKPRNSVGSCRTLTTAQQPVEKWGNVFDLAWLNVECRAEEYLSAFQLQHENSEEIFYKYSFL